MNTELREWLNAQLAKAEGKLKGSPGHRKEECRKDVLMWKQVIGMLEEKASGTH